MSTASPHTTSRRRLAWLCLGLFSGLGLACAGEAPTPQSGKTAAELLPPIQALIGDAACNSDAQCHSIGIGVRPCGGPARYLAWSSLRSQASQLKPLVERHTKAHAAEQAAEGRMSICTVLPDPGAQCRAARCELRPAAAGANSSAP